MKSVIVTSANYLKLSAIGKVSKRGGDFFCQPRSYGLACAAGQQQEYVETRNPTPVVKVNGSRMRIIIVTLSLIAACFSSPAAAAVIHLFDDDGILVGANNVRVENQFYNVRLSGVESCIDVFDGCDEPGDFAFSDFTTARLAAIALMEQVFIDNDIVNFDSVVGNIKGCVRENPIECGGFIPFGIDGGVVRNAWLVNSVNEDIDQVFAFPRIIARANRLLAGAHYIEFSPAPPPVSEVPIPGAALLLLSGFAALSLARRKAPLG